MRPVAVVFLALALAACSDYQKVLKSGTVEQKLAYADSLYRIAELGSGPEATRKQRRRCEAACARNLPLLEELVQLTRGGIYSEQVYYQHAKSQFFSKDYIMAYYFLSNFSRTFPASDRAEECEFLAALCNFKNSPIYELDQTDTKNAIDDMQLFLIHYPGSALRDSANTIVRQLRGKLEVKDLNNARQYFRLRNYQSTITAFSAFLQAWPNSEFREEALLTILEASALLARNSVETKRPQRLAEAMRAYHNFADAFPESPEKQKADRIFADLKETQASTTQP